MRSTRRNGVRVGLCEVCDEIARSIEKISLIDHSTKRRATNSRDIDNDADKFNSLRAAATMPIIVS